MATMKEMKNSMTIYYSKSSGDIKSYCTGVQDMSLFGENTNDFSVIWDFVVLPKDDYVLKNWQNFRYNAEKKQLEIKQDAVVKDYPVAK